MQVERSMKKSLLFFILSGGRVSNTWVICLSHRDNRVKTLLIPNKLTKDGSPGEKRSNPVIDEPAAD